MQWPALALGHRRDQQKHLDALMQAMCSQRWGCRVMSSDLDIERIAQKGNLIGAGHLPGDLHSSKLPAAEGPAGLDSMPAKWCTAQDWN